MASSFTGRIGPRNSAQVGKTFRRSSKEPGIPDGERQIGGFGIFAAKQITDEVRYEYRDGKNILTIRKKLA